eukprot:15479038-Alexandrium_andersonii.AAC.1
MVGRDSNLQPRNPNGFRGSQLARPAMTHARRRQPENMNRRIGNATIRSREASNRNRCDS